MNRKDFCQACHNESLGITSRRPAYHTCWNYRRKLVYIAGKVSGEPEAEVTMKFWKAQIELEKQGYEVISPLTIVNDRHCSWEEAMKKCIISMLQCDVIYLLPDWKESRGARKEFLLAFELGLELGMEFIN